MKRGTLNIGRKNRSLFDTSIKIQDMENVELNLDSTKISESGTANVRARPTVKHHSSVAESFQGFAVPTPKVPLLPPAKTSGPKINGTDSEDKLSNGSVISVPDLVEGDIFVPPPPSMAPPPPPVNFIPPPDFMGDITSLDLAALQPPSMPAPKLPPTMEKENLSHFKPPPMAPPKPPSPNFSGSTVSTPVSTPPPVSVPEHPKFAPPQPPQEKQLRTHKTPPPKPVRFSSFSTSDSPPSSPAPPPPVHASTLSTFNPQHKAKVYNSPKTTFLGEDINVTRPKQILLLEDPGSGNSVPVLVDVGGKVPQMPKPPKADPKDVQEVKEDLRTTKPSELPKPELQMEPKTETDLAQSEVIKSSPQLKKMTNELNSEANKSKLDPPAGQSRSFSPLLDRKLLSLKATESSGTRETRVASPLDLLKAAKEREKHRTSHSFSQESSTKKSEHSSVSIYQIDSNPKSFSRSGSSSSATPSQETPNSVGSAGHEKTVQDPGKTNAAAQFLDQNAFNGLAHSSLAVNNHAQQKQRAEENPPKIPAVQQKQRAEENPPKTPAVQQKQRAEENPPKTPAVQQDDQKEELNVPLLPPPPEFGDFFETAEPPPSICPPDPTTKKAPTSPVGSLTPTLPKPAPPSPPKLPPPVIDVKPKTQIQTKPKPASNQLPPTLSPNQATLLSILQKKMMELDQNVDPVNEGESSTDDWSTTGPEEDSKVPVVQNTKSLTKTTPIDNKPNVSTNNKSGGLDMKELENKLVKKYQQNSQVKTPLSGGAHSKHQHGLTFKIRPGTKQPITLVSKEES